MKKTLIRCVALCMLLVAIGVNAQEIEADQPFTVEYNYKIKWGYFDEWLELYKKNHWPILVAEMEEGQILDLKLHQSRNWGPESHRWDVRIAITFKNVLIPHDLIDRNREPIIARLYPDRLQWEREEQRRLELLDGLLNVEVIPVNTENWPTSGQGQNHEP
jgi:hypothetical protein